MLGQHPALYQFPELHLFACSSIGLALEETNDGMVGLIRAVAELLLGDQEEKTVVRARKWLLMRAHVAPSRIFRLLLGRITPRVGVEKTPATGMVPDQLARAMSAFPNARFLHLIRHPVTTQASMHRFLPGLPGRRGRRVVVDSQSDLVLGSAMAWYRTHRHLQLTGEHMPPERWMSIRAEDLISEPTTHLARVCAWLGISADPDALTAMCHPERSPYARFGPPQARGGADPGFLRSPELRLGAPPVSVPFPTDWAIPSRLRHATRELASRFGYDVPD
jgi:hypothetical protein